MRRVPRGFTLVELLVSMAILSFFLTGVYACLALSQRSYAVTQAQADAVDAALVATNQMGRMLATAAGNSIIVQRSSGGGSGARNITGSPDAVAFVSALPPGITFQPDANGLVVWQKWVCFYADNITSPPLGRVLMRTESVLSPPTSTMPAPTAALVAAMTAPAPPGATTGGNVQHYLVTRNFENVTFPLPGSADASIPVTASGAFSGLPPQFAYTVVGAATAATAQLNTNSGTYKVVMTGHFTPRQ